MDDMELLNATGVGILGAGVLGGALARALVGRGFRRKNLLIAHRGSPDTRARLEAEGLGGCVVSAEALMRRAGLVLLAVCPQDLPSLVALPKPRGALACCVAGVPLEAYRRLGLSGAVRMMISGPDTIASGRAVATCFPALPPVRALLNAAGAEYIPSESEEDVDAFTAGVCLPAALALTGNQADALGRIARARPRIAPVCRWARRVLPDFEGEADRDAYVRRMVTKGGVTEAIVEGVLRGTPLDEAFDRGVRRAGEISTEALRKTERNIQTNGGEGMERFENADVVKKANVYYDGRVASRTVYLRDGARVTLGVILPGRYEFSTGAAERMEMLAGSLKVLVPGRDDWQIFGEGQRFEIPANSRFRVEADAVADYCCEYLP
jgi:pyrroline-5-carboxylate reductase